MSLNLPFTHINEFSLHEIIQDGPYTVILRGYQKNLKRNVLVKLLKPHSSNELKERFNREARVYAKLNHPNIVSVYALGDIKDYQFIILEFVDGCSLKTLLEKKEIADDVLWHIGFSILDALGHAAARNVVHRDIKPANIMIDSEGNVKVADFGLALISDEPAITRQQALIGTPAYMSPEQISGGIIDSRSDMFSFGSLLYEIMYHEQAFGGESFSASINSILNDQPGHLAGQDNIHPELKSFLEKCLQKDKNDRWISIEEMLAEWQHLKKVLTSTDSGSTLKSLTKDSIVNSKPDRTDSGIFQKQNYIPKWYFAFAVLGVMVILVIYMSMTGNDNEQPFIQSDTLGKADDKQQSIQSMAGEADTVEKPQLTLSSAEEKPQQQQAEPETGSREGDSVVVSEIPAQPESGILAFDIVPWAMLYLNDSLIDTHCVRQNLTLPEARYAIRLRHPEFPDEKQVVDLKAGETKEITWSFWEKTGFLDLQVRPWADVFINDKYYDTTPFKKPLQLPVGTQVLELRHPALDNYREMITIIQHDTLVIKKNLNSNNGILFE